MSGSGRAAAQPHGLAPDGERRHRPTGSGWVECHQLLALDDTEATALAARLTIGGGPSRRSAAFQCVVFRAGRLPVVIDDGDLTVPDRLLELRTSGLWVEFVCETPYEHWSYGLEAFGLAIDDGGELLGRGYGHRTPLGWELEFESEPALVASLGPAGYRQTGRVHGLLLFAPDGSPGGGGAAVELAGPALRHHWWGQTDRIATGAGWPGDAVLDGNGAAPGAVGPGPDRVALPATGLGRGIAPLPTWWITRTSSGLVSSTGRS